MPAPLISIIVPVYNVSKYIEECIQSILTQTYRNFEVLLIDDGSTDDSGSICDLYEKKDMRIKVIHQCNCGVSEARNRGIECAQGVYLAFVDSDDWLEDDYLEQLLSHMKPFGMVSCEVTKNDGKSIKKGCIDKMDREEAYISICDAYGMGGFVWGKLFDRNLIEQEKISFDKDIAICEDLIFNSYYLSKCNFPIKNFHRRLYHYRKNNAGALSGRYTWGKKIKLNTLTEFTAVLKAGEYAIKDPIVKDAFTMRATKGACNTLRTMVANHYMDKNLYKRCLSYVRANCIKFILNPINANSSKVSVLLCSLSPKIEFFIFKMVMHIK